MTTPVIIEKNHDEYLGPVSASPQVCAEEMLRMAAVTDKDVVYDLGCGDGRVVVSAAKLCGARGVGIETVETSVVKARALVAKDNVEGLVEIKHQSVFDVDLTEATVVFMYLLPKGNKCLSQKLWKELKPGTRLVTYIFRMGSDWDSSLVEVRPFNSSAKVDTTDFSKLFLYRIGGESQPVEELPSSPPSSSAPAATAVKVELVAAGTARSGHAKWQGKQRTNRYGVLGKVLGLATALVGMQQIHRMLQQGRTSRG